MIFLKAMPKIKLNIIIFFIIFLIIIFSVHYLSKMHCYSIDKKLLSKSKFHLIILVLSAPSNIERRITIRNTWLSFKKSEVKSFFPIGMIKLKPEQKQIIESENRKYRDLLILPKLFDSYTTITKKVLNSFIYVYKNYDFDFLLKADDDSFILVDKILKDLNLWQTNSSKKELYWGYFNGRAKAKKRGLWKETDWFFCDYYLPYALGGGYILSYNLVKFIAENVDVLKLQNSEDVSIGLWLSPIANIDRRHDVRFDTEYTSRGCSNKYLITHKKSVKEMNSIHEFYTKTGNLCAQEVSRILGYKYDWTVLPSQCCNRKPGIP